MKLRAPRPRSSRILRFFARCFLSTSPMLYVFPSDIGTPSQSGLSENLDRADSLKTLSYLRQFILLI